MINYYKNKHYMSINNKMTLDWNCKNLNPIILINIYIAFSHLADALIQSDLQKVQGHFPEASWVKCLAQGHNVIWHVRESYWEPSDY